MSQSRSVTPVRIRLYSERYEIAASLFDTVFRRVNGVPDASPEEVSPEEEMMLGIFSDSESEGGYFVKPADPSVLRKNRKDMPADEDEGPECIELYTEGWLIREGDSADGSETITVAYEETELTGMDGANSQVTFRTSEPGLVSLTRSGTVTTAMTFRNHTRTLCTYDTPYMPFQVGIHCLTVENSLLEDGALRLDYIIEILGGRAERCRMDMRLL